MRPRSTRSTDRRRRALDPAGPEGSPRGVRRHAAARHHASASYDLVYLDHLPTGASEAAAGAVYDALVKFLRAGVRALGAVALVTAVGAFLMGPSRAAVLTRTGCRKTIGALRDVSVSAGLPLGAVGRFVHRYKQWIGGVIVVVAAIVLFTWTYPTVAVVVWTLVIVLIALAILEFLDTGTPEPPSAATPTV
ncbi:hypothetical protein SALBM311S_06233 [Streptomyces alboniger]